MVTRIVSLCASGLLLMVPAPASTQQPGQGAIEAPPPQKHGDHHELRILRVRTAKAWTMFPGGPPQVTPRAGEVLVIVEYAVKDLRSGKDDTSSFGIDHFSGLELEDGGGNKYKSPLETTNLTEIPFSVPDPAGIRVFRIAGLAFDIQSMTKHLVSRALQGQAESVTTRDITLGSGQNTFTSVVLTNTHRREYTDTSRPSLPPPGPSLPNRCSLDQETQGVIWKIVLRGAAVPAKEISVSDETGRAFVQVCWISSGGVYQLDARGNRTGGGPQTEFLAAGPDAPNQLTLKFGEAQTVVSLAK